MLQGTNWALCSCGPSPWLFKKKKDFPEYSFQMSNEWKFSCIAQTMQPFPLKYTRKVFPPIKVWRIKKKIFILCIQIPPVGNCCSFSSSTTSHLVQRKHSSERARRLEMFFREPSETKLKKEEKKTVSCFTSYREEFHHMWSSRAKWKLLLVLVVVPAGRILPSPSLQTLNQHLLDWGRRQTNDSCVNKALWLLKTGQFA